MKVLMLLLAALQVALPVQVNEPTIVKLSTAPGRSGIPTGDTAPIFLSIERKVDGTVTGTNLESGRPVRGRITGASMSLQVDGLGTIDVRQVGEADRFSATVSGEKGQGRPLIVTTVQSLWKCGNHTSPAHLAESEAEMRAHSDKHGCQRWARTQPPK